MARWATAFVPGISLSRSSSFFSSWRTDIRLANVGRNGVVCWISRELSVGFARLVCSSAGEVQERRKAEIKMEPKGPLSDVGKLTPEIQWYPGHIAKAERNLQSSLKMVDVVVELRDARIPISTTHPMLHEWMGERPRLLVFGHADLCPKRARGAWKSWMQERGEELLFIDGKRGKGVGAVREAILRAGDNVNARRRIRGMKDRAVRCLVAGYPNVGKSSVINALVGRRATKTEQRPGITRRMRWVKVGRKVEMLDMPGLIPVKVKSRESALRLAMCDEIGEAAYDKRVVACALVDEMKRLNELLGPEWAPLKFLERSFRTPLGDMSGEEFLEATASFIYKGDTHRVAVRILKEFRRGKLGRIAFEPPDMSAAFETELGHVDRPSE